MEIAVHFNRQGAARGFLVVVAIGAEVYGATALDPGLALRVAARCASEDLATRGQAVAAETIVARGRQELLAQATRVVGANAAAA